MTTNEYYSIVRLSEDDTDNLTNFDCVNTNEYSSVIRRKRKILENHSREMNTFLRDESLEEQSEGYNTTFLLKDGNDSILAYMSLCTDSIRLNYSERNNGLIGYETFPSLKIARLAVHKDHQRKGFGRTMINYAVHKSLELRENTCGVKFITLDCFPHRFEYYTSKIGFVQNQEAQNPTGTEGIISLRLHIDEYLGSLDD